MCGRFNLRTSAAEIARQFLPGVDLEMLPDLEPRYNIAPTQQVLTIFQEEGGGKPPQLKMMRWGLVPSWSDDLSIGSRMINARSETAAEKPSFRGPFKSRRCIIAADGYYEWKEEHGAKQPYEFSRRDGRLLALAGLWESNAKLGTAGVPLQTCTILTTAANEEASMFHDRMPVFIDQGDLMRWLDPTFRDSHQLQALLSPAPAGTLVARPVSRRVNSVRNQGADLLVP